MLGAFLARQILLPDFEEEKRGNRFDDYIISSFLCPS
jgi:hypothetical protein